jgi:iron complex transport system ATP-binding protein
VNDTTAAIALDHAGVTLSGVEILRGVSARIPPGCVMGVVGPNGAGKSTLLRAACGQVPLHSGGVEVNGLSLEHLSRRRIARLMCLLPQNAELAFPFTVREVVAMGRNPHLGRFEPFGDKDKEIVEEAMQRASIQELAERRVTELSGGEKQRVLLARSLATEAPILLLDEPMTGLDILHQLEVLDLLQQCAAQEKTVVAALHDLNMARQICTRILLLHNGTVVAEGPPEDTLRADHLEGVFGVHVASAGDGGLVFRLPQGP